jgi:MFS family permease
MKRLQRSLVLLAAGLLLLAALAVSFSAKTRFDTNLTEQRSGVDRQIGQSIVSVFKKALDFGVPFDRMVATDSFLETVKFDNPGVQYIIVTDLTGQVRYSTVLGALTRTEQLKKSIGQWGAGAASARIDKYFNTALPILAGQKQVGWLHLGQLANIVEQLLLDIAFDIATVLIVAALFAFEMMRLLLTLSISTPMCALHDFLKSAAAGDFHRYLPRDPFGGVGRLNLRINRIVAELNGRAARLLEAGKMLPANFVFHGSGPRDTVLVDAVDYIRWPLFLVIFADSLSLSFLPFYVGEFYHSSMGLPKHVVVGIPISVFMLVWALAMPWAGAWCDRVGYRRAFSVGAAVTTAGLLLTGYAGSMIELLIYRSITAIGYGAVFVTAQTYIANNTPAAERTRGMALFLASFFAGSLSGAAIGGILVDRLGFRATFLLSGILSAAAVLFVLRFVLRFVRRKNTKSPAKRKLTFADFWGLLQHKQFATIVFLSAIPSKVALTGILYYSVPLYLNSLGVNQSSTGRVLMAYGLAIILLSSGVAGMADRLQGRWRFVAAGGYLGAFAIALPYFIQSTYGIVLGVLCLGIAHAVGVSSQLALVGEYCKDAVQQIGQATTTGIFRLLERIGNILGPIVVGLLVAFFDYKGAFYGVALLTFVTTSLFTVLLVKFNRSSALEVKI